MGLIDDIFKPASPQLKEFLLSGGAPGQFQDYLSGKVSKYGTPINPAPTVNAYGVPLNANDNLGLYGQLEIDKQLNNASNGGVFGFASEVLFGNQPPKLPGSVSEGILGGSLGDELGKAIKPLALPLMVVAGIYLLSRKW